MTFFQRFGAGINLASDSFKMVFKHKILILFGCFAAMMSIFAAPFASLLVAMIATQPPPTYNFLSNLINKLQPIIASHPVLAYACIGTFWILISFITVFAQVCLIDHAYRIMRNQDAPLRHTLLIGYRKIGVIVQWTVILALLAVIGLGLGILPKGFIIATPLILIINIFELLIVPLLTLERVSVLRAIILSCKIVYGRIPEVLGGKFWIALVSWVLLFSIMGISFLLMVLNNQEESTMLLWLTLSTKVLVYIYITTGTAIFQTFFYDKFYKQPIEDALSAGHDLMF